MSLSTSFINIIQLSSLMGGSYLGYKVGFPMWKIYIKPHVTNYYNEQWLTTHTRMSEETFFSIMGGTCGLWFGSQLWPVVLPISAIVIYNDFNDYNKPK